MSKQTGEVIAFVSGAHKTGQTTVIANLGAELARIGRRTILLDLAGGPQNLSHALSMGQKSAYCLSDVFRYSCGWTEALASHGRYECLNLIPSLSKASLEQMDFSGLASLCGTLRAEYEFILLDCPIELPWEVVSGYAAPDAAYVVLQPDFHSIKAADWRLRELNAHSPEEVWILLNRSCASFVCRGLQMKEEDAANLAGFSLWDQIPNDELAAAVNRRGDVVTGFETSPAAEAFSRIAERMGSPSRLRGSDGLVDRG